jgi:hypothetical protein
MVVVPVSTPVTVTLAALELAAMDAEAGRVATAGLSELRDTPIATGVTAESFTVTV